MSKVRDYTAVDVPSGRAPPVAESVDLVAGKVFLALFAVVAFCTVVGVVQYFNVEVIKIGRGETGPQGSSTVLAGVPGEPGIDGVDGAMGATGPAGPAGAAGAAGAPGATGAQGPRGFNGSDSMVPGPKGDKGDQGDPGPMGPVYYSNGTAPSTFSNITVVAGGRWTGGPVFDDLTITRDLTVHNVAAATSLAVGSSGQCVINSAGVVSAKGFLAGSGVISTTETIYGKQLLLSGNSAQTSLQTQGGIRAAENIVATNGSISTAAASMSNAGVIAGTAAQISGSVSGARGVFATELKVGVGFSVNGTTGDVTAGTVTAKSIKVTNAELTESGALSCTSVESSGAVSTPLASMDASGALVATSLSLPSASITASGVIAATRASISGALTTGELFVSPTNNSITRKISMYGWNEESFMGFGIHGWAHVMHQSLGEHRFFRGTENSTTIRDWQFTILTNGGAHTPGPITATAINAPNVNVQDGVITNVQSITGHSATGTLSTPGKFTVTQLLTASGGALIQGTLTCGSVAVNGGTLNGGPNALSTPGTMHVTGALSAGSLSVGGVTAASLSVTGAFIATSVISANGGVNFPGDLDLPYTCSWTAPALFTNTIRLTRRNNVVFVNVRSSGNSVNDGGTIKTINCNSGGSALAVHNSFRVSATMGYVSIPIVCLSAGAWVACHIRIGSDGTISAITTAANWEASQILSSAGSYILE